MPEGGAAHPATEFIRVAVPVTTVSPVGRGKLTGPKLAVQLAFVATMVEPRKCFPWPKPAE
jgi:hypothetical protein